MKVVVLTRGGLIDTSLIKDELRDFVIAHWHTIKQKLLEGTYNPSTVRRVEIPKPNGGIRLLGIPTVLDRMIQQAIRQSLEYINQENRCVVDLVSRRRLRAYIWKQWKLPRTRYKNLVKLGSINIRHINIRIQEKITGELQVAQFYQNTNQ